MSQSMHESMDANTEEYGDEINYAYLNQKLNPPKVDLFGNFVVDKDEYGTTTWINKFNNRTLTVVSNSIVTQYKIVKIKREEDPPNSTSHNDAFTIYTIPVGTDPTKKEEASGKLYKYKFEYTNAFNFYNESESEPKYYLSKPKMFGRGKRHLSHKTKKNKRVRKTRRSHRK